jgi:hypothetical protein
VNRGAGVRLYSTHETSAPVHHQSGRRAPAIGTHTYGRSPRQSLHGAGPPGQAAQYHRVAVRVGEASQRGRRRSPTRIIFQCSWSSSMALTAQPIAARSLADGPRLPNTQAPATLFHPLAPSRPQSHTNKRVIGHCYAASLCARLLYSTCRPLGASSALFAAHGDETHRLGRPHEPDNTTANVTRAVGSHACAEVDMLCSLPKFPFP